MVSMIRWIRIAVAAGLAAALTLQAVPVLAHGMYYKEIEKDGRIYVFNTAANAERFEKTGEMGIGVTKPGAGPKGETIVGDSERALQLYFFKHGISEPVPEPAAPVQSIVWRDGKTRITLDNAYLEMSSRVQVRFTSEQPSDNSAVLPGTAAAGDPRNSFRIRRAKFKLEGWILRPWMTFETQVNYPALISNNANNSNTGALLEDAAFDIDFTKGRGLFRVHLGQFKPSYGAQEMTSSGSQQFVDRALVSNAFFRGRDAGIAVWGATPNNKWEWRVGMFNGNGLTRTTNDNNKFQYNARLMWQPNGSQVLNQRAWVTGALYSESDFESTTTPIYAVALNYENQNNFLATTGNDQKWHAVSVDGIYKYKGFSVIGMYSLAQRTPETGAKFDADGFNVQIGKLFHRRTWEIAFRYAESDPSDLIANNTQTEARGALSYYYARHGLKWQNDFGQVQTENGAVTTKLWEFRSQFQFIF
jgi:phosphate-selective porin OprO/OprP